MALLAVGAALMLAESFAPSFGVFGVGGLIAFVVGGLFLIDTDLPGYGIPLPFLAGITLASAAIIFTVGSFAVKSRQRRVVSGREAMLGGIGRVTGRIDQHTWWVHIEGERWRARATDELAPGDRVRVTAIEGLTLDVVRADKAPSGQGR